MSDVYPGLRYQDAPAAIRWLTDVLGLREVFVARDEAGRIVHAELGWGDGTVLLGQQTDGSDGRLVLPGGGGQVYLVAAEPGLRAAYARVLAAGAKVLQPLTDQGYGIGFTVLDPEGNSWSFGTYRPAGPVAVGSPGWLELGVPEPGPSRDFFAALFDWQIQPTKHGNANATGPGLRAGVHGADQARAFVVYFTVADLDLAVNRVRELGGTADDPGPDQPDSGRFAVAHDPQGVEFGLHQPPPPTG